MNELLNKEVINSNSEKGVVISIDEKHVVVRFNGVEKTFCTSLTFKNGFLKFVNQEDNELINLYLNEIDEQNAKREEAVKKSENETLLRNKKAYKMLNFLENKQEFLRHYFGADFVYPPLEEFKKKYGNNIWQIFANGKKSHIIGSQTTTTKENRNKIKQTEHKAKNRTVNKQNEQKRKTTTNE